MSSFHLQLENFRNHSDHPRTVKMFPYTHTPTAGKNRQILRKGRLTWNSLFWIYFPQKHFSASRHRTIRPRPHTSPPAREPPLGRRTHPAGRTHHASPAWNTPSTQAPSLWKPPPRPDPGWAHASPPPQRQVLLPHRTGIARFSL